MKDIEPLVSICCITYNHENYIRDAIEGFLMQKTSFPIEIIIHDDASTDNTAQIIKEYEDKYPDLFCNIFQNENQWSKGGGSIYARFVYPQARGKYIALCEGDDYWTDPLKLQKQVDFLEENTVCALTCHQIYDRIGEKIEHRSIINDSRFLSNQEIILARGKITSTLSLVFRKKYIDNLPNWINKAPVGDIPLVFFLMIKGKVFCFNDYMGVYRKNLSTSWSNKKKSFIERLEFTLRYNFFLQSFNKYTLFKYDKEIFIHSGLSYTKFFILKKISNIILAFDKKF